LPDAHGGIEDEDENDDGWFYKGTEGCAFSFGIFEECEDEGDAGSD
jgi:hypothetical protein